MNPLGAERSPYTLRTSLYGGCAANPQQRQKCQVVPILRPWRQGAGRNDHVGRHLYPTPTSLWPHYADHPWWLLWPAHPTHPGF